MGGGRGGGYGSESTAGQLRENLQRLAEEFPRTSDGYFGGRATNRRLRRIVSADPSTTAEKFFRIASEGADEILTVRSGVVRARFGTNSYITWRTRSHSDGSPVAEFNLASHSSGIAPRQKIHFVKES